MVDDFRINQIYEVLSKYSRRGRNELLKEVCTDRGLMTHQTFQDNLNAAVERGLISRTPEMIGKLQRVWYSVWTDFDRKEPQMAALIESKLKNFDELLSSITIKASNYSLFEFGTLVFLLGRLLYDTQEIWRFYTDLYFGDSATNQLIRTSIEKRQKALRSIAKTGPRKELKITLQVISYHNLNDYTSILKDIESLMKK